MDLTIGYGLPQRLGAYTQARPQPIRDSAAPAAVQSDILVPAVRQSKQSPAQTRLINEASEKIENGLRRTRTYEQADGRKFTRVEEITLNDKGTRRAVIQQNPSGNITRYEEILDRQDSGSFRRTQRFQDEGGDVATKITTDYQSTDPFTLTGGFAPSTFDTPLPFSQSRGTQLDLRA